MPWWGAALLVVLIALVGMIAWVLFRVATRLGELEAGRGQPDQALLLLQREIEAARSESQKGQADTISSVRQELAQFAGQMTAQVGQVGSSVEQQLQNVGRVVSDVQGSLGKLGEANQRIFEVGRSISGLEQI